MIEKIESYLETSKSSGSNATLLFLQLIPTVSANSVVPTLKMDLGLGHFSLPPLLPP